MKDDVVDKLGILQRFLDRDEDHGDFDTLQKAMDYETKRNLIQSNSLNFARTLLRLHRALLFIIQFLQNLTERPITESTATIASTCYDATLAHHRTFNLLR